MPLFDGKRRIINEFFTIENGKDYSHPLHMHEYFEIMAVTSGAMECVIDGKDYTLHRGEAVLVFPNQIHSAKTSEYSRYVSCVFAPKIVQSYADLVAGKIPVNNQITLGGTPEYSLLCSLSDQDGLLRAKGVLYLLCSLFDAEFTFKKPTAKLTNPSLLHNVFSFIQQNFRGDCSLADLAKALEYDYSYLSKFFTQSVGISYNDYVRQVRISEACYLLRNSDLSVQEISAKCGFASLRSFNRNFAEYMGDTPLAYRHSEHNLG